MQTTPMILLSALLLLYCIALLILRRGLSKLARGRKCADVRELHALPTVAIIVAARNEAKNLPRLLDCLLKQDYPREKLEICIVDDRSEDESWEILSRAAAQHPHIQAIRITDTLPYFAPKKRALDRAIRATSGEILLFTDGDCTPPPTWVKATVACYDSDTAVVPGYSPYRFDRPVHPVLRGMLSLEFFSVAAVAAASIGLHRPVTAAGCNLSYRRRTYFQAGGFEAISQWVSGDDDLFILKVARQKLGKFAYALDPQAFVPAAAPTTWSKFWNQRIRYASKGRHYALPMTASLVAVYLLNAMLFFGALSLLLAPSPFGWLALGGWAGKNLFEFILLKKATHVFRIPGLLRYFLPTALVHPLYILIFGFLGLFSHFDWKGESFQKTQHCTAIPDES